jgi:hypothetical protein
VPQGLFSVSAGIHSRLIAFLPLDGGGHEERVGGGVLAKVLEQFPELLDGQASVLDGPAHGEGVDGSCARDDDDPLAIGHGDVLAFANHPEARLRERPDGATMGHPWEGWHGYTGTSTRRVASSFVRSSTVAR